MELMLSEKVSMSDVNSAAGSIYRFWVCQKV